MAGPRSPYYASALREGSPAQSSAAITVNAASKKKASSNQPASPSTPTTIEPVEAIVKKIVRSKPQGRPLDLGGKRSDDVGIEDRIGAEPSPDQHDEDGERERSLYEWHADERQDARSCDERRHLAIGGAPGDRLERAPTYK